MKIKVIVEKGEDGYFVAHCPSLKSCWSQGRTHQQALKNIQEAIELYLEPEPEYFVKDKDHKIYELVL
ncbi:type II toxin-antitoxin system HicB family antitoxin [candidate division KSB1 bacterium]|nr:type II toxin-antitoxin system HicB family antitoxin [candidate division KSB1 bacterium]MBL7092430.1 type II toxin-antitoxin system HicB family antitoxin [candidate division KSB1 bacterium]